MNQKYRKHLALLSLTTLTLLALTGCGSQSSLDSISVAAQASTAGSEDASATQIRLNGTGASISGTGASVKNGVVTLAAAGTYVISGALDAGQILVDAPADAQVRIVLNGVSVKNAAGAALYVKQADKVVLTLAEKTVNTLSDGKTYTLAAGTDEPNAALFSKADLSINGGGSLTVQGLYNHGIYTKDDLVIAGGVIDVTAVNDAIKGKDSVTVKDGALKLTAGGEGIASTNDAASDKGWVLIEGGQIQIAAGDDGVHAASVLTLSGGTLTVTKSYEGLEGAAVIIKGGEVAVTASDDGINAVSGSDGSAANEAPAENAIGSSAYVEISGGKVRINAGGDGIDANGSLYFKGGDVYVSGPTANNNGAIDYDQTGLVSGGTLVIAGSAGMAQVPQDASTQNSILVYYKTVQKAGALITLTDSSGKVVASYAPDKDYQTALISSPLLKLNETYQLLSGKTPLTAIALESSVTSIASDGSAYTVKSAMPGPMGGRGPGSKGTPPAGGPRPPADGQHPSERPAVGTDGTSGATQK